MTHVHDASFEFIHDLQSSIQKKIYILVAFNSDALKFLLRT